MRFTPDPIIIRGESEFHWRPLQIRFALKFPTRLWIVILMSAICLFTLTISITLSKSEGAPANIFAEYADFFPGQYWSIGLESTSRCNIDFAPRIKYCFFNPQYSPFTDVSFTIENGQITHTTFSLGQNALTIGDLSALWGSPEIRITGYIVYLDWQNQKVKAVARGIKGKFDYFLPVFSIAFY